MGMNRDMTRHQSNRHCRVRTTETAISTMRLRLKVRSIWHVA